VNAVGPAKAKELQPAQFWVLTVLPMKGRMVGAPVGEALLMQGHQEPGLVVAAHELCCPSQSRTSRLYGMLAPADEVGVGFLWLVLIWMDRRVVRTQWASSERRRKRLYLAPVKENGM